MKMLSNDKKRILLISYYFNEKDTYRSNIVFKELRDKYDVTMLIADYDHYEKKYKKYDIENCKHIHVPKYNKNMSFDRIRSDVCFAMQVKKYITLEKYDLLYIIIPPNVTSYACLKIAKKWEPKYWLIR